MSVSDAFVNYPLEARRTFFHPLLPETREIAREQQLREEYHRQSAPLMRVLMDLESYRGMLIQVSEDGFQTIQIAEQLPPEMEEVRTNALRMLGILRDNLAAGLAKIERSER